MSTQWVGSKVLYIRGEERKHKLFIGHVYNRVSVLISDSDYNM